MSLLRRRHHRTVPHAFGGLAGAVCLRPQTSTSPAYSEVSKEVVVRSSIRASAVACCRNCIFDLGRIGLSALFGLVLRRRLVAIATICALWMIEVISVQVVHAVLCHRAVVPVLRP
ncbi:MAG: hypothetical protein ACLU0O_02350 [Collinsella sp.]